MRSILTMLGIIIGIGSVIMVTSIGAGSQKQVTDAFSSLGSTTLTVKIDSPEGQDIDLEMRDVEIIKNHPSVANVSIYSQTWTSYKQKLSNNTKDLISIASNSGYFAVEKIKLLDGRYFTQMEEDMNRNVILIDDITADAYYGYRDCIGQQFTIDRYGTSYTYTVVGLIENPYSKMVSMFGGEVPSVAYFPISQLKYMWGQIYIQDMSILVNQDADVDVVAGELSNLLDRTHRTKDVYKVRSKVSGVEQFTKVLGGITMFISFVAGISLFVGGIGVMNIMLVTVTERTREIGIRKSLGAKARDIRTQFLIEAIIITFMGSFIGTVLGYLGSVGVGNLIDIQPTISGGVIIVTVIISAAIGIIFGVYPAHKAAKLDPIEALRYE